MENNDIKNIWKESEKQAFGYYHQIEPALLDKAQSQSDDIFNRIRRKIRIELLLSVIIALGFPWLFAHNVNAVTGIYIFFVIALGLTTWFYLGFLKKIRNVQEQNILKALTQKEILLARYVKWQYILSITGLIVGGFFGLFIDMDKDISIEKIGLMILIMLPILAIIYYFLIKRYIHAMYGKHLVELRDILKGLKENNSQHFS